MKLALTNRLAGIDSDHRESSCGISRSLAPWHSSVSPTKPNLHKNQAITHSLAKSPKSPLLFSTVYKFNFFQVLCSQAIAHSRGEGVPGSLSLVSCSAGIPGELLRPHRTGKKRRERPGMTLQVASVVFARAEVGVLGRTGNLRACGAGACEMCIEVVHVDAEGLRGGAERLRAGHAVVGPDGAEHDDVGSEFELRVPDVLSLFRRREYFDEPERGAERTDCATSVLVPKDGENCLHGRRNAVYRRLRPGAIGRTGLAACRPQTASIESSVALRSKVVSGGPEG